jgi:hypothetical protein
MSGGGYRWFKRNTRKKRSVTTDNNNDNNNNNNNCNSIMLPIIQPVWSPMFG